MSDTTTLSAALQPPARPTPRAGVPPAPAARSVPHAASPASAAGDEPVGDVYADGIDFSTWDQKNTGVDGWFGADGFDFKDLLDIVNPLQHLPVVGTAYRALTGDTLEPGPRILGGALFGGIAGFVTSIANAVFENETGKDFGDTALAMLTGGGTDGGTPDTAVAHAAATKGAATIPAVATKAPAATPTPAAFSPLAFAGRAKAPGAALVPRDPETEDPASALIRAHAAVPSARSPAMTGLPATNYRSSLTMPDGKTLPIQFGSAAAGTGTARPAGVNPAPVGHDRPVRFRAAHAPAAPAPAASGATRVAAVDDATRTPRPLPPSTTKIHAGPAAAAGADAPKSGGAPAAGPPPDVAAMMRRALDKYESLMKSRNAPRISSEI